METVVAPDSGYTQPPSPLICRPPVSSTPTSDQIFAQFEQARTDYLSGDPDLVPSALLTLRDLKKQTAGSSDPTIALVHQEVRGILRHETLQAIAGLERDNESLADQRLRRMELNLYDEQTRDANRDFLGYLRGFVEGGRADTLDEAIGFMRSEHRRLQGEFAQNSVVRGGWIVPIDHKAPRFGSAEWTAERRNAGTYFQAFHANPNADAANVRTIRLDGGTLDLTHSRDLPEALRVVIGRQGGFIKAGEMTYTFRPRQQETTVAIQRNSILTPHLREGRDFQRDPHLGARGVGRVTEDYRGGHPQTFERFLGRAGHWTNIDLRDPDFHNLLGLHTRQGLERMRTPELRQRHLLHVAKELRHRNGSYETSARLLQGIFREPLQRAVFEVEPGEDESATLARAFEKMEAWHNSGKLRREDPVAAEAWSIFEDMKDPFNRTLNVSDEGWQEIADFLVENAIIMIPTMGMGAGVQAAVKGSRAALFMARQGARLGGRLASGLGTRAGQIGAQLGASGARMGTALAARGAFEGTLQAAGMTAFGHQFEWSQVGWNTLTQVMFHGVGAGVGAVGQRLGASRLATTAASQVALGLGDVGLSYLHNDGPDTFGERFVAGMAKMAYFSVLGRIATPPGTATARTPSAVEGRARFQSMGEVQSRAERIASAVTEGRAARYRDHLVRNKGMTEADADARVAEWRERVVRNARESQARRTRIVDTNLPPRPETAHLDAATVDHHGRFANEKNATMQMLDRFEETLEAVRGDPEALAQARADRALMREAGGDPVVAAAIRKLGIRQVTTDNLADGAWSVWLARNQARVLRDPALRTLIREATNFEDFTAFGTKYDRSSPGVELQAALFQKYNEILTRHQIKGSDRVSPKQAEAVMAEAMRAIDSLVTDPAAVWNRRAEAESFWRGVDEASEVLNRDGVMSEPSADGQVVFYDLSRVSQYPTFIQWLAVPIAHSLSLQVTVAPMPPATTASGASIPRTLMFVAIPNGRSLPTGKGLLSVVDRMNAAEATKAQELGLQPNIWFGKDNVILPNPQNGGTLLTPTEVSTILRAPENGLFHSEGGTRVDGRRQISRRPEEVAAVGPRRLAHDELFSVNSLITANGEPMNQRTLDIFCEDGGPRGVEARAFRTKLRELEGKMERYKALVDYESPEIQAERSRLTDEILAAHAELEGSGYNRMVLAHEGAVLEAAHQFVPLEEALSSLHVSEQVRAREEGGEPRISFEPRLVPPEALPQHIESDFRTASPGELVAYEVKVADWTTADQVVQHLRGTRGLAVEHNQDLGTASSPTGKDISVLMPGDLRVDVRVRVREAEPRFLGMRVPEAFEQSLRLVSSAEEAPILVDPLSEGAAALYQLNHRREVEGFTDFGHIVDRHGYDPLQRGGKDVGVYNQGVNIEQVSRATVRSWDRATISFDAMGRPCYLLEKTFDFAVGVTKSRRTSKISSTRTNQILISWDGQVVTSYPVVRSEGTHWAPRSQITDPRQLPGLLAQRGLNDARTHNRYKPFLPSEEGSDRGHLYLGDVPVNIVNERTRASYNHEQGTLEGDTSFRRTYNHGTLPDGRVVTVAEQRFDVPVGVREEVGPDGLIRRVYLYWNRTYFLNGENGQPIIGGYPIESPAEAHLPQTVWNPRYRETAQPVVTTARQASSE